MHRLGQLTEIRFENNRLELFNIDIGLMPNLQTIGFDWFKYLVPQQSVV